MGFDSKKKLAIGGLASLLLVAMVVALAVGPSKKTDEPASPSSSETASGSGISATMKAVQSICAPTDYKETCEQSLADANTTNPKDLIKAAFEATVKSIEGVLQNSSLFKEAASDERTKGALEVCKETLNTSIDDLKRSFDKVSDFDVAKMDEYLADIKTWLSGAITYQETCIDAFENTTGDTGEKMKNLLRTASELSSNGLAMVTDFSSVLSSLDLGNLGASSRRLLAAGEDEGRLLYGLDPTDYAPGDEPTGGAMPPPKRNGHRRLHNVDSIPSFVDGRLRRLMAAPAESLTPNLVVAQDGSGKYKTIKEAFTALPKENNETFVILVKAGLYKETVIIPKKVNNVVLIGEGPSKTKISMSRSYAGGTPVYHTATLVINGDGFLARDIAIENAAGPEGHQAVAVRVSGDKAVFHNVQMEGYQYTLFAHAYRQYYRDCTISGTIDFIFGDAVALFQKCRLVVRKPMEDQACTVTAQGRKNKRSLGVTVVQGCDIVAEPEFLSAKPPIDAYLGRPWKRYSRTIIMQSNIEGFISPDGWTPWMGKFALDTLYYGEYQNRGAGSDTSKRVAWEGIQKITPEIAQSFTGGVVYQGDEWVKSSGVPYTPGMMQEA